MTDQLKQLSEAATPKEMKVHSDVAWGIASQFSYTLASDTRTLAALIDNALEAQLTEARAQVAVTYEVAADKSNDFYSYAAEMASKAEYRSAAQIRLNHRAGMASEISDAIRALTPDNAATALEQVRQQARAEECEATGQWRELALQFDHHRIAAMQTIKMILASKDDAAQHVEALRDAAEFIAAPPKAGHDILAKARDEGKREAAEIAADHIPNIPHDGPTDAAQEAEYMMAGHIRNAILATLSEPKAIPQ